MKRPNKLEHLSLASLSSLVEYLWIRSGCSIRVSSYFARQYQAKLERLAVTNAILFGLFFSNVKKNFKPLSSGRKNMDKHSSLSPQWASVMKLFSTVIYHHSMAILSFCVTVPYCFGKYYGMAVNYIVKESYNIGSLWKC